MTSKFDSQPHAAASLVLLIFACTAAPSVHDESGAEGGGDVSPGEPGDAIGPVDGAGNPRAFEPLCDSVECCPPGSTPTIYTENPDAVVNAASGRCLVTLGGADSVVSTQAGALTVLAGPGDDTIQGGLGPNVLVGGDGNDSLAGRGGDDQLYGGAGNDALQAAGGHDVVDGHGGADSLDGGAGNDTLRGGSGDDAIQGGGGNDVIDAGAGNDTVDGGGGADTLRGGPGRDTISAGPGDDLIVFGGACEAVSGEVVAGGGGIDRVESPLSQSELVARGVTFSSIEQFVQVAPTFDQCLSVTTPWGTGPLDPGPPGAAVLDAVPLDDGSALVATWSQVFVVSPTGTVTASVAGLRAVLNPTGDAFGVVTDDGFEVYSPAGSLIYTIPPPVDRSAFRLVPRRTYTHEALIDVFDSDTVRVVETRLYDGVGTQLASLLTSTGLERSRVSSNHLYFTADTSLRRFAIDGTPAGEIALTPMFFEVASDAGPGRVIAVRVTNSVEVVHLEGVDVIGTTTIAGAPWNAAISPSGVYSAVNTRDTLSVFVDSAPTTVVDLPFTYGKSLVVSDHGEVFVAGSDPDGASRLAIHHQIGDALFTVELASDVQAYRPAVRVAPGGDHFLTVESGGVTMYEIERDL